MNIKRKFDEKKEKRVKKIFYSPAIDTSDLCQYG